MRYMKLADYQRSAYAPDSAPTLRTLRRRIDSGILPGKREGTHYYVLVDAKTGLEAVPPAEIRPVNSLAATVLSRATGA